MSGLAAYFPSALAQTNAGMNSYPFTTPQPKDSYMAQFFPNAPSQPNNVIRDPLMGSVINLGTLADCPDVLTLPDVIVFSTISNVDSYLYTVVLPIQNMKHVTTFRYSVTDYPQMPIEQVSELGVPRYLHHRKWTTTTSLTRWAIGNRYSMEYLDHPKGQQQQINDKIQVAVSFSAHLDMIVLNGLKTAHHQLRSKLTEFGSYEYTDVCNALEFHKTHFAALQKREHGWSFYMRKIITKMQAYGGSATALIADRSICDLFANRPELIEFSRTGALAAPRINNPQLLMAENTPFSVIYTEFKPATVGSILSPMQHIVQIGNWFVSEDLSIFTSESNYPMVYSTACREPQIYDQELDTFVTLKLRDMVKYADIFNEKGQFRTEIFDGENDFDGDRTDLIGDLFGGNGGESSNTARLLIESFIYKICSLGNIARAELDSRLENGRRVYEKMASQDFDRPHVNNLIRWACTTGRGTPTTEDRGAPSLKYKVDSKKVVNTAFSDDIYKELIDTNTSSLKMNRALGREHALPTFKAIATEKEAEYKAFGTTPIHQQPPSTFCGHLSWDGFVQMHAYYEGLSSGEKDAAEADWVHVYKFVEAIKLIVQYWRRNLVGCGLFDSVANTPASLRKSPEESLVDQAFNFNATFELWTNSRKFPLFFKLDNFDQAKYGNKPAGDMTAVKRTAGVAAWAPSDPNIVNENYLAAIYDRLVAETFADMLNTIERTDACFNNPKLFTAIKKMLSYSKVNGLLASLPDMLADNTWANASKKYKIIESIDIGAVTVTKLCEEEQLAGSLKENAPVLSGVHWALVGEWVLRMYEIGLYAVCQALLENPGDTTAVKTFITGFNNLFKRHTISVTDADLKIVNDIATGADDYKWDTGDTTEFRVGATFTSIAKNQDAKLPIKSAMQSLWFVPGTKTAIDLVNAKEKQLNGLIKTLIPGEKQWTEANMTFKPNLPNATNIENGDIPLLRTTRWTAEDVFSAPKPDVALLNEDLTKTFAGAYTKKLAKVLGMTSNDKAPGHGGDVAFYGERKRSDMFDPDAKVNDLPGAGGSKMQRKFDVDGSLWVKTPLRLSYEQVESLYTSPVDEVSELDFRVCDPTQSDYPAIVGSHIKKTNMFPGSVNLIRNYEELMGYKQTSELSDVFDSKMLPFMNARSKCLNIVDGVPLAAVPRKHIGDNLFGYRLNLNEMSVNRIDNIINTHVKRDRSPLNTVVCLLAFTTPFNKRNSDSMIDQGVIYPVDFIIWRLWANYVANIMFLVNPGIRNLGFVALAAADHRSGSTPLDKTGMFNSSIWAGPIITKPENTMTLYNAAITSFGRGGGSGYIQKGGRELEDPDARSDYRTPAPGESSASLLVSMIRKGSSPKRNLISVTGRLPEGDYESAGFRKSLNDENDKHYTTCDYYANKWGLGKYGNSARSLAEMLGPDGIVMDTNVLAYKGTTRYYDPYNKNHNVMSLNTGHFGTNEGPGCKDARSSGTPFPEFGYERDQLLRKV